MAVPNYSRFAFTVPEVLSSKMECKFKHVEKSMARPWASALLYTWGE
jgi:hypothetical protein